MKPAFSRNIRRNWGKRGDQSSLGDTVTNFNNDDLHPAAEAMLKWLGWKCLQGAFHGAILGIILAYLNIKFDGGIAAWLADKERPIFETIMFIAFCANFFAAMGFIVMFFFCFMIRLKR